MTKNRRWLTSAIEASAEPQIALPWQRGSRRRPQAMAAESLKSASAKPGSMPARTYSAIAAH